MLAALALWLQSASTFVFWACAGLLVLVDGIAVMAVAATKDRVLVNKWTGPVLIANAVLLGAGVAVPVAMRMTSAALMAVAPASVAPSAADAPASEAIALEQR